MLSLVLVLLGLHSGVRPLPAAESMRLARGEVRLQIEARPGGVTNVPNALRLPGDTLSRTPEWMNDGRHVTPLFPAVHAEDWLVPQGGQEAAGVARAVGWLANLPVQVDVKDRGVYIALRLRAPY